MQTVVTPVGATASRSARDPLAIDRAGKDRLTIRDLRHSYGAREVLKGLSFSVGRGEVVGLLGPNGCGKSTTFQILLGLVMPVSGEILLDGAAVAPGDRRLRSRVGVVFQSGSVDLRLSARENLLLSARLYGMNREIARSRLEELLRFMELGDRADEPVIKWSGGMKRRLELVRALLHEPDTLLLDEPTSGLDEASFQRTWDRILSLRDAKKLSVLLTTHRPEEAELCDRVAILDGGAIVAEGTPSELKARVSGDVISLEADDLEALARDVESLLNLKARVIEERVVIEHEKGHALIPRLVEALPPGRLRSVSMRRPSLADVFVKLTGRSLRSSVEEVKS
ncbi:MAG: ABC transporter ATP-binding protein [Sandaracinaceae bacterium]|nr:ABC transporter ATP-binding protein [Sandaracinaceae bacterium]